MKRTFIDLSFDQINNFYREKMIGFGESMLGFWPVIHSMTRLATEAVATQPPRTTPSSNRWRSFTQQTTELCQGETIVGTTSR